MYDYRGFERPSVAADIAAFGISSEQPENKRESDTKKIKILLVKRGEEPFKNKYALPGGFLRKGETIEDTALRELMEETGIKSVKLIPLKTYSEPDRDSRGWIISCSFIALTRTINLLTDINSDAECACWMDLEFKENTIILVNNNEEIKLEYNGGKSVSNTLAFDHDKILYDAFMKLRDEVKNHDLIFDLLPEYFTIADFQTPYEMITGKKELPASFRRKMSKKIEETDMYDNDGAMHRPSKLYKRKDNDI